jgi:hypothetical protein
MGFSAVNYLDDFGGAEILEHAQKAYLQDKQEFVDKPFLNLF